MNTLHILNGDATLNVFLKTEIAGETLVWRELLSEGPVTKTDLWATRLPWVCENFGANALDYQQMVVAEADKLQHLNADQPLLLWFEFDLVCQINLIYILSLLKKQRNVFLICPASFKDLPNFRGLGELNPTQLASLMGTKVRLQESDLQLASKMWDLYVENNPDQIAYRLNSDFGTLALLKPALTAHLLRFPSPVSNLNHIEEVLLKIIKTGVYEQQKIYSLFWETEPIFGMTDLQIDLYLKQLAAKGYFRLSDLN
ncbi:MAG: DUF1835 domain-containing protein [Bacteroidota bacterium]